jgi:hypothetical protein
MVVCLGFGRRHSATPDFGLERADDDPGQRLVGAAASAASTGPARCGRSIDHALPHLIAYVRIGTRLAVAIAFVELRAIAWMQNPLLERPFARAVCQVVLGGSLALAAAILIGSG